MKGNSTSRESYNDHVIVVAEPKLIMLLNTQDALCLPS